MSPSSPAAGFVRSATYPWLVLALLVLAYSCTWMDRYLILIVMEPMRRTLHLSDTQMGLVAGLAFSVTYSLAGFPFARWADRGPRRTILSLAIAAWSTATMLGALATGFVTLAISRLGVATFEAACSPTSYSLISDYFRPSQRGRAIAVYSLGISLGIWSGLAFGGTISHRFGWRAAFFLLGLPGIVLSVLVRLVVREPPRGGPDKVSSRPPAAVPLRQAMALMVQNRALVAAAFGLGTLTVAAGPFEAWVPTYLIRARGLNAAQVGMLSGIIEGVGGICGTLATGWLCDRLSRRDVRWYLWLPMLGFLLFPPSEVLFFRTTGPWSYVFYALCVVASSTYTAPLIALGQLLLPPNVRALGAASMLFILNMIGVAGGDFLAGFLSDHLPGAETGQSLESSMLLLQVASIVGLSCLLASAMSLKRQAAGQVAGSESLHLADIPAAV